MNEETEGRSRMIFDYTVVGPFQVNCFVLGCPQTREALIVDPGDDPTDIAALLTRHSLAPRVYLLTHGHIDHVGAATPLRRKFGGEILIHADDVFLYEQAATHALAYGIRIPRTEPADRYVAEGETIRWGQREGRILHTPGHSPGGICLRVAGRLFDDEPRSRPTADRLFCGDTLFQSGVGRTDLPGGSYETLMASIAQKLLPLPDDTIVAPGHGPLSTMGVERRLNPFLQRS